MVCGTRADLLEHHVTYEPEATVTLCRGCHTRVHKDSRFRPDLTPKSVPADRRFRHTPGTTTVQLYVDTRDRLLDEKDGDETYDDIIRRLLGDREDSM